MRYVIFGAGAIGGIVGAKLHQADQDVMLIARGAHYERLAGEGLTFANPSERVTLRIPVAASAAAAGLREGDVVLLCVKSQQTEAALEAIRDGALATGVASRIPVVCLQNGVANERAALRLFPDVYGAVVLIPAEHLAPGYVVGYLGKIWGRFDLGRYPNGEDDLSRGLSQVLVQAGFEAESHADVMRLKYAKLLGNLVNAIHAVCGPGDPDTDELAQRARREGSAVLRAAGIEHQAEDVTDVSGRWERMGVGEVDGHSHQGGSTWQSVVRGAGSVETDYLNGEIVMLGRELGVPTPCNELLQNLTYETVLGAHEPGWRSARELLQQTSAG
jgi:2-dehydropantoate 2-reductase